MKGSLSEKDSGAIRAVRKRAGCGDAIGLGKGRGFSKDRAVMRRSAFAPLLAPLLFAATSPAAELVLVESGEPRAEIVISETPERSVRLAAHELQESLQKISGARLPIRTEPSGPDAVRIFVGRSRHTEALGIGTEGLEHGAYRIASGPGWIVLLGDDADFVPKEPWARNNTDIRSGKLQSEWESLTGEIWGVPNGGMYKHRLRLPGDLGKPEGAATAPGEILEIWGFDERGSYNAVCGLLRRLGMRWYLPGELGEVVPRLETVAISPVDETVHPDFAVRRFNVRFAVAGPDTARWAMRLGLRDPNELQVAHGMDTMTGRDAVFAAHPEWFALYGGRRHYTPGSSKNQLCYSRPDLLEAAARWARAQFDVYDFETVSIMPPDGYTAICQCEDCAGKDDPARADRGHLSDYVWDFVNRVAREVGKTHPGKRILNCAYGAYTSPPLQIERLEPNVQVCIVGGRRPTADQPEQQAALRRLREEWAAKTSHPILIFENYPFTDRGWYLPSFVPRTIGASINETKGISMGEDIWLSLGADFATRNIGYNHFPVYFTARMYWGGKEADAAAMLHEYCRLFYGPAGREMLAFFDHCEAHWSAMEKDKSLADEALALFDAAKAAAPPESVHARRIGLLDDYLEGLRRKSVQLGQKRGRVPALRLVGEASEIVVDGRLDEPYWRKTPVSATGRLRELQTGRVPTYATSFQAGWRAGSLYLAIRCEEAPGEALNVGATKKDDPALWYGDCVEILLETEARSYYQIAVAPSGAVADLDRSASKDSWFAWDAQAEVATHVADDHWTVEIRIPTTRDENDPLHQVIGAKPTQSLPWHVNICRQRVREDGAEHSAYSPTGAAGFHHPMKFAHFFDGRSHTFEASDLQDDFLTDYRAAEELARSRRHEEALAAFLVLAERRQEGRGPTELQRSAVLEQAAASARAIGEAARAEEIASSIPIEAVAKATRMQNLLAAGKAAEALAEFGSEDFSEWPFWKRGEGHLLRGRAHAAVRSGEGAAADLEAALPLIGDPRQRQSARLALARAREQLLGDDESALPVYRAVYADSTTVGGADELAAVQGAAAILVRAGRPDEALAELERIDTEKIGGTWRHSTLLARAEAQAKAGRRQEALALARSVRDDESAEKRHRDAAAAKLAEWE